MYAKVIVEIGAKNLDQTFYYHIPSIYEDKIDLFFEIWPTVQYVRNKNGCPGLGFFQKQTLRQRFESKQFTWEIVRIVVKMIGYDTQM